LSEFRELGAEPPAISTQAELLQRLRERGKAVWEMQPSPPSGSAGLVAERKTEEERRIAELRSSLERQRCNLETQHTFARLHGHAKSSFEQEK